MPIMLANICCVCGSADIEHLGEKHGRDIGKCTVCGLIYTLQYALDYGKLYTEGSLYHAERIGHIPYRSRYLHDLHVAASRIEKLKHIQHPRSLDVGCANGAFVELMRDNGWRSEGLELNPGMAIWATEHTGCTIHTSWETVRAPFQVITYHDVIEHVTDPIAELERARDHLTLDGLLILDTPDGGAPEFLADVLGNKHTKPLEHLWFFSQQSLEELLREAGFFPPEIDRPIPGKIVAYARRCS
jgi:SAM-dependent methyltransferase